MISTTSVVPAASRLSIRSRSVAWSSPLATTSSTRLRNSSGLRMFSGIFSRPTSKVVTRSDSKRTNHRNGATRRNQADIGLAMMAVLILTGLVTAMVLGVTSPNNSSSGTMMKIFSTTTVSVLYR